VPLGLLAVILMAGGVLMLGIVETNEDEEIKRQRRIVENRQYTKSVLALLLPVLYCLIDAAGTVADSIILESLDETVANTAYELTFLFLGILAAVYVLGVKHERLEIPREVPKLAAAVCETAGQFFYIYAINATVASAPIISCYCLVSVIWSRIFLHEKLSWKHYLAIVIAGGGIALMGMLDEM
jgi:drug/metabolite transporter (DMT)-like permease